MSKKELLFSITKKDFKIEFFSGTGAGGQYRNKHQNCVRLTHTDSKVTTTGQSNRDQKSNLREAFRNMMDNAKFKIWYNQKIQEILAGQTTEEKINDLMNENNLLIEGKNEKGQWDKNSIDLKEEM